MEPGHGRGFSSFLGTLCAVRAPAVRAASRPTTERPQGTGSLAPYSTARSNGLGIPGRCALLSGSSVSLWSVRPTCPTSLGKAFTTVAISWHVCPQSQWVRAFVLPSRPLVRGGRHPLVCTLDEFWKGHTV